MPQNEIYTLYDLTGLDEYDLADVFSKNPRSYMAVKGAVAEKHLEKILRRHADDGVIEGFKEGASDFDKDFYVLLPNEREIALECKNVEVLKANNKAVAIQYIKFLVDKGYITIDRIKQIMSSCSGCRDNERESLFREFTDTDGMNSFLNSQLQRYIKSLINEFPVELKSSGIPRYNFSRTMLQYPSVHDTDSQSFLSQFADMPLSIDFQRTRNTASEAGEEHKNRLYKVGEIDMVGACLFSRTKRWEFIYAQAQNFEVHGSYPEHYRNTLRIDSAYWTTDLCEVLSSFIR